MCIRDSGGRAGEAPKDPVVREATPNVTSECGERRADPGLGRCRVAGTKEAGLREEPRLVEQLTQPEAETGVSQGKAAEPSESSTPTDPYVQDAQLRDENIAPILLAKLSGGDKTGVRRNSRRLGESQEVVVGVGSSGGNRRSPVQTPRTLRTPE